MILSIIAGSSDSIPIHKGKRTRRSDMVSVTLISPLDLHLLEPIGECVAPATMVPNDLIH